MTLKVEVKFTDKDFNEISTQIIEVTQFDPDHIHSLIDWRDIPEDSIWWVRILDGTLFQ